MYIANSVDEAALKPGATELYAQFLQTKLSLNGGADWQPLTGPPNYRFGQCNTCPPSAPAGACTLQLHGPTSWFAPEGERGEEWASERAAGPERL